MTNGLTLSLKNSLDEIPRLADAVEEYASEHGLPTNIGLQVTLALDELVTNVISYGFDESTAGNHEIIVRMMLEDSVLTIVLEDDGRPFDPTCVPPPDIEAALDDRPIGGLGIHFVKSFMDQVDYKRTNSYNSLTMRKTIVRQDDDDPDNDEQTLN